MYRLRILRGRRDTSAHGDLPPLVPLRERLALSPALDPIANLRTRVHVTLMRRTSRPWTAMVSVPLLMNASILLYLWWVWPALILCMWWWAARAWTWTWLVAVEAAALGSQWAFAGAVALGTWPAQRPWIAALWIAFPAALSLASLHNRRRYGHHDHYPGY